MSWGVGRVLRDRNAAFYIGGVVVSGFGSSAMALAGGVWAKSLTGSDSLAALTTFCVWAPMLLGPLIGTIADRVRSKPLLIWSNLSMAALLPALVLVDSEDRIWLLFAVLIVYGVTIVLMDAAEAVLVAAAVPEELRGDFNGLRLTANEGMKLLAPLLGAGLFIQFGGQSVALLNAVTFAFAAAAFTLLRVSEPRPARADRQPWTAQVSEGVRFLRTHPVLWRLVVAGAVTMGMAGVNGAALYAIVDSGLHRAPAFAGMLYTVQGAGSVLSGLFAGALLRRMPERVFTAAGILLFALGVALRAVPSTPVVLVASAMIGAGLPCVLIAAMTAVQRETPGELMGRVAATANTLLLAPNPVFLALGAGLLPFVDHRVLIVTAGVVAAGSGVVLLGGGARKRGAPTAAEADVEDGEAEADAEAGETAEADTEAGGTGTERTPGSPSTTAK
ncbi:MFS transporter [Streptomyces lasiicapitis]|uniref:MFS transporter n=1 Tax=Streptomyces lasiicapitis TaxID=1923961 RepID=UPI0036B97752